MEDTLFNTEEKRTSAIASFRSLLTHPGWLLFQQIVDANIDVLKEQLENGIEGETKADVDRIRDKIKVHRYLRDTPKNQIKILENKPIDAPNADPYMTTEELQKEQKKKES